MPAPRNNDEFPSELQASPRLPDRLMLFQNEPATARFRDDGRIGFEMLISHDDRDETGLFVEAAKPSRPWFALSIALLCGTVGGFASGYIAADRRALPQLVATEVTDLAEEPARAVSPDSPVERQPSVASDAPSNPDATAVRPSPPTSLPPTPAVAEQGKRAESTFSAGQTSLEIVSRPSGAQVSLDGRVVGKTPLFIGDVRRGTYVIGIELTGYNRWATSVLVTPGRTRVGASLEPLVPRAAP